jgi:hypothetical protein
VTLEDADFRKSPMKMVYRKLSKTASLPHLSLSSFLKETDKNRIRLILSNLLWPSSLAASGRNHHLGKDWDRLTRFCGAT